MKIKIPENVSHVSIEIVDGCTIVEFTTVESVTVDSLKQSYTDLQGDIKQHLRDEAHELGFRKGATVRTPFEVRKIQTDTLNIYANGNILTGGKRPFWIRLNGKYCAEVIKPA